MSLWLWLAQRISLDQFKDKERMEAQLETMTEYLNRGISRITMLAKNGVPVGNKVGVCFIPTRVPRFLSGNHFLRLSPSQCVPQHACPSLCAFPCAVSATSL